MYACMHLGTVCDNHFLYIHMRSMTTQVRTQYTDTAFV